MIRILFVCHGNICRSPMAEMIFRDMCEKQGISGLFSVSSAATSDEEIIAGIGNPVYPPAKQELIRHGIPFKERSAVQLTRSDYGRYDLLLGMDDANIRNMRRIFGSDPEGKIKKLMDYTDTPGDVSDPWYSDRFDIAFRDIEKGCRALLSALMKRETEPI